MNIGPISTEVNKRMAEEELRKKLKIRKQEKTLLEDIDARLE